MWVSPPPGCEALLDQRRSPTGEPRFESGSTFAPASVAVVHAVDNYSLPISLDAVEQGTAERMTGVPRFEYEPLTHPKQWE
jgi:hypothetical protein